MHDHIRRSDVFRLLADLLSPKGWERVGPALTSEHWVPLVSAASHHFVTPALGWRLRNHADLPDELAQFLDATLVLNRARNERIAAGIGWVGQRLNDAGIEPLLLKGAAFIAMELYSDIGFRFVGDLDLLIAEESLPQAQAAIESLGFDQQAAEIAYGGHHLPMLTHPELGLGVELHRQPVELRSVPIVDSAAVFAGAARCTFRGCRFLIPSATHRVLLSIVHDQIADDRHAHGVPSLRPLIDVAMHQSHFGSEISWEEIADRFGRAGRLSILYDYLAIMESLMAVPAPLPLGSADRAAVARMEAALDRSRVMRMLRFLGRSAGAAAAKLHRAPAAQLKSLRPSSWKARARRLDPRW